MRPLKQEITDLTACRAIFAAWVFAYHVDLHAHFSGLMGGCAGLIRHGYLGVDGFFLLSGLILTLRHPELANSRAGAGRFLIKRLARIYPVHLAVIMLLGVVVGIGLLAGVSPRDPGRFTLPSLIENLLLIHGWGVADQLAWNYPSWSVSTEWAGYLLFPALWFTIARLPNRWVACVLVASWLVLAAVDFWSADGLNLTIAYALTRFLPEFIAGIATAKLIPVLARHLPGFTLAALGLILAVLSLLFAGDICVVGGLWMVLTGFATQAVSGRASILPKISFLRFLGHLSYAFYMSFGTIELFLAQLYRHQGWDPASSRLVYSAAMTVLTFILALSLHGLVENPARAFIDRRLAGPRPLKDAAACRGGLNRDRDEKTQALKG